MEPALTCNSPYPPAGAARGVWRGGAERLGPTELLATLPRRSMGAGRADAMCRGARPMGLCYSAKTWRVGEGWGRESE